MMIFRLGLMMFLQFFIWGAWYLTVGTYMAEVGMGDIIYWAYTVGPLAALIAPFFLGMVADRFVAAEKLLGLLSLLAGLAMYAASRVGSGERVLFIGLLLVHSLCYFPTIGLASTLTFHHIANRERHFPVIRAFGALGWLMAGVLLSAVLALDGTVAPLQWAAAASGLFGLYSFTLPHTPPQVNKEKMTAWQILGLDALQQLKSSSFLIFIFCFALISVPYAAYSAYTPVFIAEAGLSNPGFKMSLGQFAEVPVMFLMPFLFLRMGFKAMFVAGIAAWGLRFALFAASVPTNTAWMIMAGVLLHGICYDFIYVTGQIYVDQRATAAIRGQAQGLLVVLALGISPLIGAPVAGWLFNHLVQTPVQPLGSWQAFWIVPAVFCFLVMGAFGWFFKDD